MIRKRLVASAAREESKVPETRYPASSSAASASSAARA